MIGIGFIIFIILCLCLLENAHAGELFLMGSESFPDAVFLSTEHRAPGTNHKVLICSQQKFGALLLCTLHFALCTCMHFPFSLAQCNGSFSGNLYQFLILKGVKSGNHYHFLTHRKINEIKRGGIDSGNLYQFLHFRWCIFW
jgi:hypothetical protein